MLTLDELDIDEDPLDDVDAELDVLAVASLDGLLLLVTLLDDEGVASDDVLCDVDALGDLDALPDPVVDWLAL